MVADEKRGCLYISDRYGVNSKGPAGLYVVNTDEEVTFTPLDMEPGGLSLDADGRLMVICEDKKICRYLRFYNLSIDGGTWKLQHHAELDITLNIERYLLQAAIISEDKLDPDNSRLVISQHHKKTNVHRIICVNGYGEEVRQ